MDSGEEQAAGTPPDGAAPPWPGRRQVLRVAASGLVVAASAGCGTGATHTRPTPSASRLSGHPALKGTNDWRPASVGPPEAIEGYADRVSVRPGETFALHVSTTARTFRVSAFRVGWYDGAQAALVWVSHTVRGSRQGPSSTTPDTRMIRAGWDQSLAVPADGWPKGAYLLRLEADNGHQRYVPLVVRSVSAHGRTLLMHAPATWQAYNDWGGNCLYYGAEGSYARRAYGVSFERPYAKNGAEKFLVYERAAVVLAERAGIPLAYTTGLDVHRDPGVLKGATTTVALGHDEYWTPEQRRHVTAARDAGTNLVFLGANTCFRRIRLASDTAAAPPAVVCYKTDFTADPYLADHPRMATTDFRGGPGADPESSLTGVLYEGFPTDAPYVVQNPDHWAFRGTGVRRGERFAHLVGVEYDRVTPSAPTPESIEVVAHSPLVCNGRHSHSDSAYYTVPSGAGVFATGTMRWVEGLMAGTGLNGRNHRMDARTGEFVTKVTENVLTGFAAGPALRHRPAPRENVKHLYA
ncbi:N,N-dimethylformamidase beta subunit family domain-containing protein [Streptomyces sp. NRRL F-5630]|uniref:N,N-dimethylformamidase beta subunit family domain-containing protein n=1 Tax=unclassified Streptomyces TaxID=2593676 RepID=UPI000B2256E7|nr:N,N-dimethylformamidase beta subunit family domain-containing protein [Streptomyces sp. NRRL F-5630]